MKLPLLLRGLAIALVAVVLLYPLSMGPARMLWNLVPSEPFRDALENSYAPLEFLLRGTPLRPIVEGYGNWSASLAPYVAIPEPIVTEAPPIPAP